MRICHVDLIPYLPDAQFKGQLRELIAIMRDWRDKGTTNHILINRVMEYPRNDLAQYFILYDKEYYKRYGTWLKHWNEICQFNDGVVSGKPLFDGWHDKEYLRVCMANLYEKHRFGVGKSRITDDEWAVLVEGYKKITGEEYTV